MSKSVVIVGGGSSVKEGIATGLWEKIKPLEVWGLNYTYKLYPYKLNRQIFVDFSFFKNNQTDLENLAKQGIPIHAKKHSKLKDVTNDYIIQYNSVREAGGFRGKTALKEPPEAHIYVGSLGLVGTFALSLAIAEEYNTIYLLGFDFGPINGKERNTHWYQDQIKVVSSGVGKPLVYWEPDSKLKHQVKDYAVFTNIDGVKIYNVSLQSNIPYLPKISYQDFYKLIEVADETQP
jgi:hypothetical protein